MELIRQILAVSRKWRQAASRKFTQLQYPNLVTFKCPACGGDIPNFAALIHFGEGWTRVPFGCPACGSRLCVSSTYSWSVLIGSSALALAVPFVFGIGPWILWLGTAVLSWIVLGFLTSVYVKVLFPPKIIRYEGLDGPRASNDLSLNLWRKR